MGEQNKRPEEIKGKYLDSKAGQIFSKKMEYINNETNEILSSDQDIVKLKKDYGRKTVSVVMSDGDEYRVMPDQYLQLYYDKVEQQNKRQAKVERTRIEVVPYQNKVAYYNADTKEFLGEALIDMSMDYTLYDDVTGNKEEYSKDLNPAIMTLLDGDKNMQKAYMQGNDNIEIVYDFNRKSSYKGENRRNRKVVKQMDKYCKSENEYMKKKGKIRESIKIGFAGLKDKIKALWSAPVKKVPDDTFDELNIDTFLDNGNIDENVNLNEQPVVNNNEINKEEQVQGNPVENGYDSIDKFIEEHSIIKEEEKKQRESQPVEYVDLAECTVEDKNGNVVLDTKEVEDIKRAIEKHGQFGKVNHMGYRRTKMPNNVNKRVNREDDRDER